MINMSALNVILLPAKNAIKMNVLIAIPIMDFLQQQILLQIIKNVQPVPKIAVDVMLTPPAFNVKLDGILKQKVQVRLLR